MEEKMNNRLAKVIDGFSNKRALVLGDAIIDEYVYGSDLGSSLSSPETKKLKYEKTEFFYGGAGNIAKNLLKLGAKVTLITLVGNDDFSTYYKNWKHKNLSLSLVVEEGKQTTVKSRFCSGGKKIIAVERFDEKSIGKDNEEEVLKLIGKIENYDVIILQDQGHGFFTESMISKLRELSEKNNKFLINSQTYVNEANHLSYKGFHTVFMNLKEARIFDEQFDQDKEEESLTKILGANVCVTLGEKGAVLYKGGIRYKVQGKKVKVVDLCGAGDSFLSAYAVSDFEKDPHSALVLANMWAALSVQKSGTETPKLEELKKCVKELTDRQ